MHLRKWQTLLVAGTITGAVMSAAVASAAPAARRGDTGIGDGANTAIISPYPLAGLLTRSNTPLTKALVDNKLLAILVKLKLSDTQLSKAVVLVQKAIDQQKSSEAKLLDLLAAERRALLAEDREQVEDIRDEMKAIQRESLTANSRLAREAWDLLTPEQRKTLTQLLPDVDGKQRIGMQERPDIKRRPQFRFRMAPDLRSRSMIWRNQGGMMPLPSLPGKMQQLPRWHPDQELPALREHTGRRLGMELSKLDMLSRLEALLKEMQAARQGQVQDQPAEQLAGTTPAERL